MRGTKMSRQRRNPQALSDPKLSVVIPVYNEKNTLEELLRRVIDDPTRKEIILVDDFSTDGTRQMLEKMQQLQAAGESTAPAGDGGDPTPVKVFRAEVLKGVAIKSDRFGFEPEITAKIAKKNWRIYEVAISYAGRTYEEGKKITWKDGVKALWCIVWFSISD